MAQLSAIRTGLSNNIDNIAGLIVHKTIPDQIVTPCAVIGTPDVEFDTTMARGADKLLIPVRVYASRASDRSGQEKIDEYLASSGATSIKAAIESDVTLGGAAHTLRVRSASGFGVYNIAGSDYLGVEFTVEVIA